jgi:hypothetical protein
MLANTLQVTSRDIANLPIKSSVAYRNGDNGYDEVDARLGILASPRMRINAGGLIKGYGGTTLLSDYQAQKINTELDRGLGRGWSAHYRLLFNKFDLDIPLFENPDGFSELSHIHRKDVRFDHGLSVGRDSTLAAAVRYTTLRRELYGSNRSVLDLEYRAARLETFVQTRLRLGHFWLTSGIDGATTDFDDGDGTGERPWRLGGFSHLEAGLFSSVNGHLGARIVHFGEYGTFVQPELSAVVSLTRESHLFLWASRWLEPPSPEQKFSRGPFGFGSTALEPVDVNSLGCGFEWKRDRLLLFTSAGIQGVKDGIAAEYWQIGDSTLFSYLNQPQHTRAAADIWLRVTASQGLKMFVKAKFHSVLDDGIEACSLPDVYAKAFVEARRIFFKGDLDARLHLGVSFVSARTGGVPYYAEVSPYSRVLDPIAVPYIQAFFKIKDATLFVIMRNPLQQEYQLTYGYPMPVSQFRWGLVWRFVD